VKPALQLRNGIGRANRQYIYAAIRQIDGSAGQPEAQRFSRRTCPEKHPLYLAGHPEPDSDFHNFYPPHCPGISRDTTAPNGR